MDISVQITLIICGTIIFCNVIVLFAFKNMFKKKHEHDAYGIGHNPNPPLNFKKPGFPGSGTKDNSRLEKYHKRLTYPTYTRPLRPGTRIPGTSSAKHIEDIKPPINEDNC